MKKKIFIDTDIFLDTVFGRNPHFTSSQRILSLCEQNDISGHTSSLVIANLYYIINKVSNHSKSIAAIAKIRAFITILPFTDKEISESINAEFKDFEDGAQYFIAMNNKINCFVTRNVKDFRKANISVLTPKEFLEIHG